MDKKELKNKLIEQSSSFAEDVRCKLEELNSNDEFDTEDDYISSIDMLTSEEFQDFFTRDDVTDNEFINIPDYSDEEQQKALKKMSLADKIAQLRGVNIPEEYIRKK